MSPDLELSLREQFTDLIVVDTSFDIPDSWHEIVANMLFAIRDRLDGGRCRIECIYIDEEYGYLRARLRGEQLPARVLGRVRAEVLKGRWHAAQTREFMLHKFPSILAPYVYVDIPVKWHIPVREALAKLSPVVASANVGFRILSITSLDGHLAIHDNRAAISSSPMFFDFIDTMFAYADDVISGTLDKLRGTSVLPFKK